MRQIILIFILAQLFLTSGNIVNAQPDDPSYLFKSHIEYLSSTEMNGRFPGTPENIKAQDYIVSKFKDYGLKSFSSNYLSPFKFTDTLAIGKSSDVEFKVLIRKPGIPENLLKKRSKHWEAGKSWIPMRFSKDGFEEGDLVFCGYGVTSKESGYDDYQGVDVKGKVVIVLADSAEGLPLDNFWTPYSDLRYKVENAEEHGASAIILVKVLHDSANVFYDFDVDRKYKSNIIAINANRTELAEFFPKTNPLLKVEEGINKTKKPNSFILPDVSVAITVEIKNVESEINNVIAYVPGTDETLKNEYIIMGANFDALGAYWETPKWRPKIWTVLNGADANASGVAVLLEIAKNISVNPLKRSVIFVAFNGNSTDLDGSRNFISNPPVQKDKIALMINLSCLGGVRDNKLYIIGRVTGSNLSDLINKVSSKDSILRIIKGTRSFQPEDHLPFYNEGIPVLMISTGIHTDFGKPSDTYDKINFKYMPNISEFIKNLLSTVSESNEKPVFNPDPMLTDYREVKSGNKCWLGIIPDYEHSTEGIVIGDIYRNSPAEKAHLKSGDIILKFEGKSINSDYELKSAVSLTKPGDSIQLTVKRDGSEKVFNIKMEKNKNW